MTRHKGSATVAGGLFTGVTVTNGGSGYTTVPHVRIDPPAYDALATVPALVGGAVDNTYQVANTL